MKRIAVQTTKHVNGAIASVYDSVRTMDLTRIMKGYGPLPAVTGIEDQEGDWDAPGQSRRIRLADGHSLVETLNTVTPPDGFSYTLTDITSVLRFLVSRFHGTFSFVSTSGAEEDALVEVCWRYEFEVRNPLARPLAWLIITKLWRRYMKQGLALAAAEIEASSRGRESNDVEH